METLGRARTRPPAESRRPRDRVRGGASLPLARSSVFPTAPDGNWKLRSPLPCAPGTPAWEAGNPGTSGAGGGQWPRIRPRSPGAGRFQDQLTYGGNGDADRAGAWRDPGGRLPSRVPLFKAGRGRCPRSASGPQDAGRLPRPGWGRKQPPAVLAPSHPHPPPPPGAGDSPRGGRGPLHSPSPSLSLGPEGSSGS